MGKLGRFNLLDMKINGCEEGTRVCGPEKSNSPVLACLLRDDIRLHTGRLASSITSGEDLRAERDATRAVLALRRWQNLSQKKTFVGCHIRLLQPNFVTKQQNIAVQAANTEEI